MQKLEKPKFKHNKKRNTAFLFETIVKELTKATVYGDKEKQKFLSSVLKEHFKKNSILDKELILYKQIYETNQFPKEHAEKLISEVLEQHEKLNDQEIFNEQSKLIAKLNKFFGPVIYDNFVPKYKTLATISQIFNKNIEPKRKIILESELTQAITSVEEQKQEIKSIDKLTMNRFIDKFNETYANSLLPEQKLLLSKYINSSTDSVDLKVFLNEEIGRLKKELLQIKTTNIVQENIEITSKVEKLISALSNLRFEIVNEELIKKTMLIQEFVKRGTKLMAVQITVKDKPIGDINLVLKDKNSKKVSLAIRKTLDGNLLIHDHYSINIVIMPDKGKIITFPKEEYNDICYADQDDLFKFLTSSGVIKADSINGGNIYGSLEGIFPIEKIGDEEPLEVVILNIHDFLTKQKANHEIRKQYADDLEKQLTDPDEEDSTEMGEIPHDKFKGSIPKWGFPTRGVYRYNY